MTDSTVEACHCTCNRETCWLTQDAVLVPPPPLHVVVERLDDEVSWRRWRTSIEALEAHTCFNPWSGWNYAYHNWRLFAGGRPCWLIGTAAESGAGELPELYSAGFFFEEEDRRRYGTLRSLRSIHMMASRVPTFLLRQGYECSICRTLLGSINEIASQTGCHLSLLRRQDKKTSEIFMNELARRGIYFRKRLFSEEMRFLMPEDVEAYCMESHSLKRHVKDIQRRMRKIERETGERLHFVRKRGCNFDDPLLIPHWQAFEKVRCGGWQFQKGIETGNADAEQQLGMIRALGREWGRKGLLDLSVLYLGSEPVAALLSAAHHRHVWAWLTAFDDSLRSYGVGIMMFYQVLLDSNKRGDICIELGGEDTGWKETWANSREPIYEFEWRVGGLKGRLWSFVQSMRHRQKNKQQMQSIATE